MIVRNKVCVAIVSLLIIVPFVWFSFERTEKTTTERQPLGYHSAIFFEEKLFFDEILRSSNKGVTTKPISGGVIPHHLLASDIIIEFFSSIPKSQSVQRVVLIGPNHYERGDAIFTTSKYGWKTPVGDITPDLALIEKLEGTIFTLETNEEVMGQEHSIGGMMPFIAHYLPNTRVVPISISGQAHLSDIKNFAILFENFDNKETIFIASVDFSHYLSLAEAERNDKEILKILRQGDLDALLELDEDHTDSPESLALLLLLMNQQNITSFNVVNHKNSADYTNEAEAETTSYYSLIFTR